MRIVMAGVVVASSGCNTIFSLDRITGDAAMADAAPADTSADTRPRDAACATDTVAAALKADTQINSTSPLLNFGGAPVINIGVGIDSVGLFRFDLSAVPADATIQGLTLTLPYAPTSSHCSTNCGSCSFDTAGTFSVYFATSDWTESGVTWIKRTANTNDEWSAPGANGMSDRSELVETGVHDNDMTTEIELPANDLAAWRTANNELSILIEPGAGTVMVVAAKERVAEGCNPPTEHASLQVEYCP